jgi:DNA-binding transcriptional ArsR family regulator
MAASPDQLSSTFAALADPTRRAILARLAVGGATVSELSKPFSMSSPAISKHLKVLERAGLITRGRDAQFRPCQLRAAPLATAADWLEEYRRFWSESFDRLTDYLLLETQPAPPKKGKRHARAKPPHRR